MCRHFEIVTTLNHARRLAFVLLLLAHNILKRSQHSDYRESDPVINRNTQNQNFHDKVPCKMSPCLQKTDLNNLDFSSLVLRH